MPFLIPLFVGLGSGAYLYNKIDDKYIDPIFGNGRPPVISNTAIIGTVAVVAGVLYAKKQRWI